MEQTDPPEQCLLALLDSPLSQSGNLQISDYTATGLLIQVHTRCLIPRTFSTFAGLMLQLLRKRVIRAQNSPELLLFNVVNGPIQSLLPENTLKIGTLLVI
jgi:rRNA pseudouridine-1189 N-methylase Emg1 (Nep1/Mra1 family)